MTTRSAALAFGAALTLLSAGASAQIVLEREPWRPPALEASPMCDVWSGTGSGNDKTLLVEIRLCEKDKEGGVTGQSQYSGKASGWTVRKLEGQWKDAHRSLTMKETEITENRPNEGWRFCTVDAYAMKLGATETEMTGTYDSAACHDHGTLALRMTRRYQEARPDPRPKMPDGPPTVIPPSKPPAKSSCACDVPGAPPRGSAWQIAIGLAVLAFLGSRRR